jgi:hypothetical protein
LREGRGDAHIIELIRQTVEHKLKNHGLVQSGPRKCVRQMSTIGG